MVDGTMPPLRRRRILPALAAAGAGLALAGCGAGAHGQPVAVNASTTGTSAATTPSAATAAPPAAGAVAAICRAADLRGNQQPVSAGTGRFYLNWSLTNTGRSACVVPAGQPTLAFLDASGAAIADYTVTHLPTATDAAVRLGPGRAAWFLTEEATTSCGTGTTVAGGPFRYVIGLPGGAGSVTWTASYLRGRTLGDFCPAVSLGVGDLQATEPTAT